MRDEMQLHQGPDSIQFGTITDSRLKGRTGNGCEIVAGKSSFSVANFRTVADLRGIGPILRGPYRSN